MRNQFNRTLLCLAITAMSFFFFSKPFLVSMAATIDSGIIKDMAEISMENDLYGNIPTMIFFAIVMLILEGKLLGFDDEESSAISLVWQIPLAFIFGIFGWYGIPVIIVLYIFSKIF